MSLIRSEFIRVEHRSGVQMLIRCLLLDDAGRFSIRYSITSFKPLSVLKTSRFIYTWDKFFRLVSKGESPPLPFGWRVLDGAGEAVTLPTPDHLH